MCHFMVNHRINDCYLFPVIALTLINYKSVKETNAKLNKDFALILIEISFLPINTSEKQIVPWRLAGLHLYFALKRPEQICVSL